MLLDAEQDEALPGGKMIELGVALDDLGQGAQLIGVETGGGNTDR